MGLADVAAGSGGGSGGLNNPFKSALGATKKAIKKAGNTKPAPQPTYSPPPPSTTSTGSYSGGHSSGGGAPVSPPQVSQGPIGGVGQSSGGNQAAQRQRAIERRQAQKERKQERRQDYRSFMSEDDTYQNALTNLQKTLKDYRVGNRGDRGDVREDFRLSRGRMGDERERSLEQMEADFAARGLLNSSEYLDSVGDYNQQYQQRLGDLRTDRDRNLEDLLESLGMFKTEVQGQRQNAREEALRRRAAKFSEFA